MTSYFRLELSLLLIYFIINSNIMGFWGFGVLGFWGADSMSRAADVPTYLADIMLATALLFMVLAIMLTRFRVVRD